MADRSFNISTNLAAVSVGAEVSATITAAASWLIKGMVISVTSWAGNSDGPNHANAIITKVNSSTSINIKWLTNPGSDADPAAFTNEAAQLGQATVIGTAFAEGTGAQMFGLKSLIVIMGTPKSLRQLAKCQTLQEQQFIEDILMNGHEYGTLN